MRFILVIYVSLIFYGCGDKVDSVTINRLSDGDVIDEYDLENLNKHFLSHCSSIYKKVSNNLNRAELINSCVQRRMKPFLQKYAE